ncbi:hypothetical protein KXW34_004389 [Aspergillus fumigatus]|nr:hypothetical protein KXW34_004389 [Aspergillus fumigatus]
MDFWEAVVKPRTIPAYKANKSEYITEQISGSSLAQHYDTVIESGTAHAWFTNGLALVMLHVPKHEPDNLYYLCGPNLDVDWEHEQAFHQEQTAIAQRLVGAALVQEYHVMIQEGLAISYLTNGLALALLHIPYDDPITLCYYLCEPNMDVNAEDDQSFHQPTTAIARVFCLCFMSFSLPVRDQEWRNSARPGSQIWKTSFDHTRAQIPEEELQRTPPNSGHTGSQATSSEYAGSDYQPSSPLDLIRSLVVESPLRPGQCVRRRIL